MNQDYVTPKRWEGKPFKFKWKYMWANYPEIGVLSCILTVAGPLLFLYKWNTQSNSMDEAIRKYKYKYRVVRDDDPRLPRILAQKEKGREYFPK